MAKKKSEHMKRFSEFAAACQAIAPAGGGKGRAKKVGGCVKGMFADFKAGREPVAKIGGRAGVKAALKRKKKKSTKRR
jgi:hypothetical protein